MAGKPGSGYDGAMAAVELFCSGPPEITDLMSSEASRLGAAGIRETGGGIECRGTIETAYRLCLWSRLMNRVQLRLAGGNVTGPDDVYELARSVRWHDHLGVETTFAVHATMTSSDLCAPNFAALRVKDAVADFFRDAVGRRPSVDSRMPSIRLHLHIRRDAATISLDLSGESLHRRGYRLSGVEAMLKENVAAAMLIRAEWPDIAASGGPLIDPMCGAGTLPIEAALIAGNVAPGLERSKYGFLSWRGHEDALWRRLIEEARELREEGKSAVPPIAGFDIDPRAIRASRENAERAGVLDSITFRTQPLDRLAPEPEMRRAGLVVADPPYGKRSAGSHDLTELYRSVGATLKRALPGWRGALLSADESLSRATGLWARKTNVLHNGAVKCILAGFEIRGEPARDSAPLSSDPIGKEYREIFTNRLRKNLRSLKKWLRENEVTSYRVYDADVPEFSVAIDLYEGKWAHVQEYTPPPTVSVERAKLRLEIVLESIPDVFGIPAKHVYYKERRRQSAGEQYEKLGTVGVFFEMREGGLSFLINLTDYLDTGVFLDHRIIRARIRDEARDRRFLNLFSYTGAASVYAAAGGAISTTSVDLSNTYTEWARENFELNELFGDQHRFVRSEVRKWLGGTEDQYDLILLDPPTFSRSKSFAGTFQVQRDHPELINAALRLLAPDGILYFSTNFKRFRIEDARFPDFDVEDITEQTIPFDFRRNKRIHHAYRFARRRTIVADKSPTVVSFGRGATGASSH